MDPPVDIAEEGWKYVITTAMATIPGYPSATLTLTVMKLI